MRAPFWVFAICPHFSILACFLEGFSYLEKYQKNFAAEHKKSKNVNEI